MIHHISPVTTLNSKSDPPAAEDKLSTPDTTGNYQTPEINETGNLGFSTLPLTVAWRWNINLYANTMQV